MKKYGDIIKVPDSIAKFMLGKSMPYDASMSFDKLRYLNVPHYNFSMHVVIGEIIVAEKIADEVLEIFANLFNLKYPIEKMVLIDRFYDRLNTKLNTLDKVSMAYNNSYGFCYRKIEGENRLSNHSFGTAIDLNPVINPYISIDGSVSPDEGSNFVDRNRKYKIIENKAIILKGDEVYNIFKQYDFSWGGEIWTDRCFDYHHFQKI